MSIIIGSNPTDTPQMGGFDDTVIQDVSAEPKTKQGSPDLVLGIANLLYDSTQSPNQTIVNDRALYKNVGLTIEGRKISAMLTLTAKSDPRLTVNLAGGLGREVLLNVYNDPNLQSAVASFTLEFFVPDLEDQLKGDGIAINAIVALGNADYIYEQFRKTTRVEQNVLPIAPITKPKKLGEAKVKFHPFFDTQSFVDFTLEAGAECSKLSLSGMVLPRTAKSKRQD